MSEAKFTTIDEYIALFPKDVQILLEQVRSTIKSAAPDAVEAISYQIPTFKLQGNLVHFAAFKNHIGFYPGAAGIANFQEELRAYKSAKGSVQFPFEEAIPHKIITKIVRYRVEENLAKAASRKRK